jgi:outer membrane biosynthesis protein TonB
MEGHEPYYAHKEVMAELGLATSQLPTEIKNNVIIFNQKKRFAKNPELISELQNFSELIADEVEAWHEDNAPEPASEPTPTYAQEPAPEPEPTPTYAQEPAPEPEPAPAPEPEPTPAYKQEPAPAPAPESDSPNGGWGINTNW